MEEHYQKRLADLETKAAIYDERWKKHDEQAERRQDEIRENFSLMFEKLDIMKSDHSKLCERLINIENELKHQSIDIAANITKFIIHKEENIKDFKEVFKFMWWFGGVCATIAFLLPIVYKMWFK